MPKRLSYEEIKKRIENEGYILLSTEYKNSTSKLKMICPNKHEWNGTWRDFRDGCRCPKCSRKNINKKYDFNFVNDYFKSFGYTLLSKEYNSCDEYLEVMCPNSHKYKTTFSNFKNGSRCKECYGNKKYSFEDIAEIIKAKNYKIISNKEDYINSHSEITLKCTKGHIYTTKFYVFNQGHECPYCTERKVNFNMVKYNIEKEGYILLSKEYKNNSEKLEIKCPNNHIYNMSYNNFQGGCRCPICNSSNGEQRISYILNNLGITYKIQYRFSNCKGDNKTLPFDFYIEDKNILIEYDGIQHFEPIDFFGGKEGFEKQQKYDNIKNQYCKDNNIKLIRIPYFEFSNIEKLLKENFND